MTGRGMSGAILDSGRQLMLSRAVLAEFASKGTPKQASFLLEFFTAELASREENKRARLLKKARFPAPKSFETFDWSHVRLPESLSRQDLTGCAFLPRCENMVFFGGVGTGKTHLATAIGSAACGLAMETRFFTASELILTLARAKAEGRLDKVLSDIGKADLVIIDEWGYVPVDTEGARLLFQVIADSYERRSLLLTTNLEFSRWGSVLTDDQMAAAMIDRLVHHGHMVIFEGESYRIRHALMRN